MDLVAPDDASEITATFAATCADNSDGSLVVECERSSGDEFSIGEESVTCTCTDPAGRSEECTFSITVTGKSEFCISFEIKCFTLFVNFVKRHVTI